MSQVRGPSLRITDLTFRDGQQSLLATRMRTEDIEAIAHVLGQVGYHAIEVWGGATFDSMHRFLGEDPWERPRQLRRFIPKSVKLQMLLRGQNLVGYRNYADDVVRAFVEEACDAGIEIFRVFDALNDERNFETAAAAILRTGMHFQAALSYTVTEGRMGGELFTLDYWIRKARALTSLGAHSICIKDMAGLLSPEDAAELVPAIKKATGLPLELHCHTTSGLAEYTLLRAIDAGVDIIDTCSAPLANRTSHPAVEPIAVMLRGTPHDPCLNLSALDQIAAHIEEIGPKYRRLLDASRIAVVDIGALTHQVPGGMLSNLVNQLREAGAEDRLPAVFEELPRVRADLGYPPLVTPTSQLVGVQAVQNVLFGKPGGVGERYAMISDQVKDYCFGLYGKPPGEIDPELKALALKGYPRGEKPIDCRPGDILSPELEKVRTEVGDLARDRKELLLYALFPTTGKRFLRVRRGLEAAPAEWTPRTLEDAQAEEELIRKALAGALVEKPQKETRPKSPDARTYTVRVDGESYEVEVEAAGGTPIIKHSPVAQLSAPAFVAAEPAPGDRPVFVNPQTTPVASAMVEIKGKVVAPLPGILIHYPVKQGDDVTAGMVVAVVEAMKMENRLTAPVAGTIRELFFKPGDRVSKEAVLLTIC